MAETSLRLITTRGRRWRKVDNVPRVTVQFVDAQEIIDQNIPFIRRLQMSTAQFRDNKTVEEDRYMADLFYIAPLYHLSLPALDNLIMMDASDLEFADSVELIHDQFKYLQGGKLIGLGLDLSSNYYIMLANYRNTNPDSMLGYPGEKQGFNTGVVLYNLRHMRRSSLYNSYLKPDMVTMLAEKYKYPFTLAEQVRFSCS